MRLNIQISPGEMLDRLTICEIKAHELQGEARRFAQADLEELRELWVELPPLEGGLGSLYQRLRRVNRQLWDVEEELRAREQRGEFGGDFVELARSVYQLNDLRSALKAEINRWLNCSKQEQKSHSLPNPYTKDAKRFGARLGDIEDQRQINEQCTPQH